MSIADSGRNLILTKHAFALLTCTFLTGMLGPLALAQSVAYAATISRVGDEQSWGTQNPFKDRVPRSGVVVPQADMLPKASVLPSSSVMQNPPLAPSVDLRVNSEVPQTSMPSASSLALPQPEIWGGGVGVPARTADDAPVDLEADNVEHDESTQIVTAMGNVELVQGGRILKADSVAYNLQSDRVRATGNVVLSEADGTTYFADDVELTDDMKDGFVEGLQVLLADGSRFTAKEGERTSGTKLELKEATYTPCEPCKEDPTRSPLWQLRANKVTHDEADKTIVYRDAWFEFAGVPLAYTPYFSHPDGSEKQKSGVLTPTLGYDSELGASYEQQYYWAIAPDKDATFGTMVATGVLPVALGEYRQRFENAKIKLNGSATYSDRTDSSAGQNVEVGDEARGHMFADAQWDMNEKWRSGAKVRVVSDDQYLRQYNIDSDGSSDDVLENELYAERFSGRNYVVGRALAFQDVRTSDRQVDQPAVLPEVIASFYGDPNGLLGGRWNAQASALGLYRDGSGQDVGRGSMEFGWQRRFITGFGLVNKFDALLRGDAYNVQDRDAVLDDSNETHTRGFAQANWETSYPFVKRFEKSQVTLSPVVSFTAGNNVDFDDDIPNEDSQDFVLDPTNLFEPNRFAGYDLIEDRSHMTYGLRTGWYGDNGYRGEVFFGQSLRFEEDDNPFKVGSGLSDKESDYVGQIAANIGSHLNLDYRFQLNNDDFSSQRHEISSSTALGRLELGLQYFYDAGIEGTDLAEKREQIGPSARLRVYEDWYMSAGARYDMAEETQGLRSASYGIDYIGQCINLSLIAQRTLTRESTGDSETEILLRVGLKNLGEFESSGVNVGSSGSSNAD